MTDRAQSRRDSESGLGPVIAASAPNNEPDMGGERLA